MPSAPHAQPRTHEFQVRFSRRLKGAAVVTADEARQLLAPPPLNAPYDPQVAKPRPGINGGAAPSDPQARGNGPRIDGGAAPPAPTPAPPPPEAVSPPPAALPQGFQPADVERELRADRARIETVLTAIQGQAEGLRTERAGRLAEFQKAAVELALTISARLLHERIESGTFAIENKIQDMIDQIGEEAAVTVRLNPADLNLLNARLGKRTLAPFRGDPRFVPDPELGRGDCRVEGREAMLLSDVTRELEEIREELLRSLKNART